MQGLSGISGGAILGDGSIALILDTNSLIDTV
jgi:chemotaxis protein histidine kinase CheA